MEALIDRLVHAFTAFPNHEPSLTVLRAIVPRRSLPKLDKIALADLHRCFAEGAVFLKVNYSALRAVDHREIESALTALGRKSAEFDAADVCEAIAAAFSCNEGNAIKTAIADLVTDYVTAAAEIWMLNGIKPTRIVHSSNLDNLGHFHRFVDLVLTSIVDPRSKRYDGDRRETTAKLYEVHARLPKDVRKIVSLAAKRSDIESLVTDHNVRKALARLKKAPLGARACTDLADRPIRE